MSVKITSPHQGHRKRLKARFLKSGLKDFEDHNVLELLLFYALPYKDTNELAHRLISRFGTVERVFDADIEDLCEVEGVGENVATLIKLVPAISNYYLQFKHRKREKLDNVRDIADFLQERYALDDKEIFSILCLDNQGGFIAFEKMEAGTANMTEVSIVKAIQLVLKNNASCIVIAHNHPGGVLIPSIEDIATTRRLCEAISAIGARVMDHIIVSKDGYLSMINEKHYKPMFK